MSNQQFHVLTWALFIGSLLLAFGAWGSRLDWQISGLNGFQIFPLLGLFAWMTMWGHYITGALRVNNSALTKPAGYSKTSSYLVLGAILLHPGLLVYEQYRAGNGLPPGSYTTYVGKELMLAVLIATIALLLFLSFEVFDRISDKPIIKKYWWLVSISQSVAMILIFVHALRLGSDVMKGWFNIVWIIYGLALIPCFFIIHRQDFATLDARK